MAYSTVPFHGKLCRVEKNNVAMSYSLGWTINATLEMADTSAQGDAWKTGLPGLAGWNGSFTMHFVMGNTEQAAFFNNIVTAAPGTKLTDVKFLLDASTNAFSGDIFITGVGVTTALASIVQASVNFQGDGALTISNAA